MPDTLRFDRPPAAEAGSRRAYFGAEWGWLEVPVVDRAGIESAIPGPLIVEEYDATCIVPPGASVSVDAGANIVLDLEG